MKIAIKNESIALLEHFFVSAPIFLSVIMRFPHCCTAGAAFGSCVFVPSIDMLRGGASTS